MKNLAYLLVIHAKKDNGFLTSRQIEILKNSIEKENSREKLEYIHIYTKENIITLGVIKE
ncbi:MAG: hypothetical protein ACFFDH_09475 [Promethearchaeota archaeon]